MKVCERGCRVFGQFKAGICGGKRTLKQFTDDLFLVVEVIIQIAWADARCFSNMIRADCRSASVLKRVRAVLRIFSRVLMIIS